MVINLLTKVLPALDHHVGTVNRISADKHGRKYDLLGRTGQGNIFSGVACRDVSHISRKLERKKIGIIIKFKCKGNTEQIVVIVHLDDEYFCTSSENSEMKMQEIVSYHMKMHEATGGKVQKKGVTVLLEVNGQQNKKRDN